MFGVLRFVSFRSLVRPPVRPSVRPSVRSFFIVVAVLFLVYFPGAMRQGPSFHFFVGIVRIIRTGGMGLLINDIMGLLI